MIKAIKRTKVSPTRINKGSKATRDKVTLSKDKGNRKISSKARISKAILNKAIKARDSRDNQTASHKKDRVNRVSHKVIKTKAGDRIEKATARKILGKVGENRERVTHQNRKAKERVKLREISHKMVIPKSNR